MQQLYHVSHSASRATDKSCAGRAAISLKSGSQHPQFFFKGRRITWHFATASLSVRTVFSFRTCAGGTQTLGSRLLLVPYSNPWQPGNPATRTHCKRGCIRNSPRCSTRQHAPKQKQLRGTAETRASHASSLTKPWLAAACAGPPSLSSLSRRARQPPLCQARGRRRMPRPGRIAGAAAEPAQAFAPEQISMIWVVICACQSQERQVSLLRHLRRSRSQ